MEDEIRCERRQPRSDLSILVESSFDFLKECFSPFTPYLQPKSKSFKASQNLGLKAFERCEYITTFRPPIQLFATNQEIIEKKTEETPGQSQRKQLKPHKNTSKIFQSDPSHTESVKNYREFHIYKSLGSVARKNLEKAIAAYNMNREEFDTTRRFTSLKNLISHKKEQAGYRKVIKTETVVRPIKQKADNKEKISKVLKQCSQGKALWQKKSSQPIENYRTNIKHRSKPNKELQEETLNYKTESWCDIKESAKVHNSQTNKIVLKSNIRKILPKLPVKNIERKMKEKKQLAVTVLNLKFPILNEQKDQSVNSSIDLISKTNKLKQTTEDPEGYSCKEFYQLDEPEGVDDGTFFFTNKKKLAIEIRGKHSLLKRNRLTNKRSTYSIKLPKPLSTEPKSTTSFKNHTKSSSKNIGMFTLQESTKVCSLLPQNGSSTTLPQNIIKKHLHSANKCTSLLGIYQKIGRRENEPLIRNYHEKDNKQVSHEIGSTLKRIEDGQNCRKGEFSKLRQLLLGSSKSITRQSTTVRDKQIFDKIRGDEYFSNHNLIQNHQFYNAKDYESYI